MPSITDFYEKLVKFSDQEQVPELISDLKALGIDHDELIDKSRNTLQSLMSKTTVKKDDITLAQVAHMGLLALAEFKPINDVDPCTKDLIEENDKVFTSTGHCFSIRNLIIYHNTRDYRGTQLGEQSNNKWLLNPLLNKPFDLMDVAHIQAVADEKKLKDEGIVLRDLKTSGSIPTIQDSSAAALVTYAGISNNRFRPLLMWVTLNILFLGIPALFRAAGMNTFSSRSNRRIFSSQQEMDRIDSLNAHLSVTTNPFSFYPSRSVRLIGSSLLGQDRLQVNLDDLDDMPVIRPD